MVQDKTIFYCDSVSINETTKVLEAFGNVHINDNDSVHTYSDYLRYNSRDKKAFLKGNVKLTDGKGVLLTPTLDYDVTTKTGIYTQGGKLTSEKTVLTSKEGYYYGETRDVYFKKKVVMVDPESTVTTDTLLFNTYSRRAIFTVPTHIAFKSGSAVNTSDGYYDFNTKKSYFGKRSLVKDSTGVSIIADEMANDDSTGFGEARGRVIYKDSVQGTTLLANNVKSNKKDKSFLATEQPVMILKQDKDSIYIAADTFYSAKLSSLISSRFVPNVRDSGRLNDSITRIPADTSNDRFIEAWNHVRIFSDSLQAVGDSLFYSLGDSTFRLFRDPIVWAQDSQVTGDTIYIYTANKKPERMFVFDNAMMLNKMVRDNFYNQVRGRNMNGYFKDGAIDYMRVRGSQAESIYYATDEFDKYIGVDKASADVIELYFANKKPEEVKLITAVKGTFYPMMKVDHEEIKLRGFKWHDERRPKTKYALFGN
jgi:lipopolysaccharide export system protein LptA